MQFGIQHHLQHTLRFAHRFLLVGLLAGLTWACFPAASAQANAKVQQATSWYLKGNSYMGSKQYTRAVDAFRKAYTLLPRHPHFNCHRAQFLNYMGRGYEQLRRPHQAMQSFYTAAYRSRCTTKATTIYAANRYRYLYGRWMCSIKFVTNPPKARIYQITSSGDKLIDKSPFKKVFSPGTYKFKVRLYDHRTIFYEVTLRPGRHLVREFKMVKGDDPVHRVEKVDIAPPVAMSQLSKQDQNPTPTAVAQHDPNKVVLGNVKDPNAGLDSNPPPGKDLADVTSTRKVIKPGPPVYKQVWFWAVIGGVAAAAIVIPIVIPKEQKALISQGKMF